MTTPVDGRISSLALFTGTLATSDLFVVVSPGNATTGINYKVPYAKISTGGTTGGRTRLSVATTFYVATTGSDSTGDGTVGNPWKTLEFAIDYLADHYELGEQIQTIQLADGTYAGATIGREFVGGGYLQIAGNPADVTAVVIDGSLNALTFSALCFNIAQDATIGISDVTMISGSSNFLMRLNARCNVVLGFINFSGGNLTLGACNAIFFKIHCHTSASGSIIIDRAYPDIKVSGSCAGYLGAADGIIATVDNGSTITMVGTPAFSTATYFVAGGSNVDTFANTFVGSATGKRFVVVGGAVLTTWNNGTRTYIPGNAEGTLATGASVVYQ